MVIYSRGHQFIMLVLTLSLVPAYIHAQVDDAYHMREQQPQKSPVTQTEISESRGQSSDSVSPADFHYSPDLGVLDDASAESSNNPIFKAIQTKSGLAFLSSALIPGSAQAINNKWLRGSLYFAADLMMLGYHYYKWDQAVKQQQHYRQFTHAHWSVSKYAKWLVDYNNKHFGTNLSYDDIGEGLAGEVQYGKEAWDDVNLNKLNKLEKETRFVYSDGRVGNTFSHVLPSYGSQQYYELISKYYQFGPGWDDFGTTRSGQKIDNLYALAWDGSDMSFRFYHGADLAERFNTNYRIANNMVKLMILNHMISAFDGYFTVKLKQSKVDAEAAVLNNGGLLTLNYRF